MDMRTAARPLKKPGNKDFIFFKNDTADRAYPVTVTVETVNTAADMHKPVFAAVQRGEGQGAYQFSFFQFGGTYGTGLGFSGYAFAPGFKAPVFPVPAAPSVGRDANAEKEGITEPKQGCTHHYKNQNFENLFHCPALAAPSSNCILSIG